MRYQKILYKFRKESKNIFKNLYHNGFNKHFLNIYYNIYNIYFCNIMIC